MSTAVEPVLSAPTVRRRVLDWYGQAPGEDWLGASAFRGRSWRVPAAVAVIALLAAVISGWNFGHRGYPGFYSSAARSMSQSWRAFFFGSFDPAATVTLDKLSGFLVPQALSARLFGFHPWSINLPQVIEGVVTVIAAYVIGARWKGPACGLLAAGAVTTTPLLVAMFGRGSEDCLLTMSLTLALLSWQAGMLNGRLRPLIFTALWIAIGFQAKMMQAWFILPAVVIAYLLGAPHPLAQRLRRSLLLIGLTVVLSLSWITAIMLVPAADRPYIDGSTNNNGYTMVFGYNGFNRIIPNLIPGAVGDAAPPVPPAPPQVRDSKLQDVPAAFVIDSTPAPAGEPSAGAAPKAAPKAPAVDPAFVAEGSKAKLVDTYFLPQIGWFYPLALAGILLGLWPLVERLRRIRLRGLRLRRRRVGEPAGPREERGHRGPLDPAAATVLALVIWLATAATFLTIIRIPHTAYLAAIGLQVALLAAGGLTQAVAMRSSSSRVARSVLPALVGIQTLWAVALLLLNGQAPGWILPAVAVVGGAAVALLSVLRPGLQVAPQRRSVVAVALGIVAIALVPSVWTGFVMTKSDVSEGDPYAGPRPQAAVVGSASNNATDHSYGFDPPFHLYPDPALYRVQNDLVRYVRAHPGVDGPMMATDLWGTAEPYIEISGLPVVPFGGFSGYIDTPTVDQLATMVANGTLRFALLHAISKADSFNAGGLKVDGGGYAKFEGYHVLKLRDWVQAHCTLVPVSTYSGPKNHLTGQNLYACAPPGA